MSPSQYDALKALAGNDDNDDYEVIILRRKRPDSPPPSPFFSLVLALVVSSFTVWLLLEDSGTWRSPDPPRPVPVVPG